jgi:hypothetical protein
MIAAMNDYRVLFWIAEGLNMVFLSVIAMDLWLLRRSRRVMLEQQKLIEEMCLANDALIQLVLRKTDEGEEWKHAE